jgi:glycosyltransferase involved in cell wall biosynthesis
MSRQRLLLIVLMSRTLGERVLGGVDAVCQMIVEEMIRYDYGLDIRVLAFDPGRCVPDEDGVVVRKTKWLNIQWFNAKKNSGLSAVLPNFLHHHNLINTVIDDFKPDLIHAHGQSWLLSFRRAPAVLTLHSYRKIARNSHGLLNDVLFERILEPMSIRNADYVTSVSKEIVDVFKRRGRQTVGHILNPVHPDFFSVHRKPSGPLKLLVFGQVIARKRIHDLVPIVQYLKRRHPLLTVYVAGRRYPQSDYDRRLMRAVQSEGLEKNFRFYGDVNHARRLRLCQKAHIGLSLSDSETFGLAPLEMMAAGLPVVLTETGICGWESSAWQARGAALVQPGDIEACVQHIELIVARGSVLNSELREFVNHRFRSDAVVRSYLEIYQQFLGQIPATSANKDQALSSEDRHQAIEV